MKKKLIMLGIFMFALGANVYARHGDGTGPHGGNARYAYCNGQGYNRGGAYGRHSRHNYLSTVESEKLAVLMEEKSLEIRKELLKETPDWGKIEKLNIEMQTEQAKVRTKYIQARYTESQKN